MRIQIRTYYFLSYGKDYDILDVEKVLVTKMSSCQISARALKFRRNRSVRRKLIKVLENWQGQKRVWSDDTFGFTAYVSGDHSISYCLSNATKENGERSTTAKETAFE